MTSIIFIALLSRAVTILLSILSSQIVPTYDLSFQVIADPSNHPSSTIFESLCRWDGVYFIRLAQTNLIYEYEQFHAFFPFLPKIIHFLTHSITAPLNTEIIAAAIPRSHYIIVGVLFINITFIATAYVFYHLTLALYNNERKAYYSTVLFCLSPASIFFSAIYTESPFALFSFTFMLCHVRLQECINVKQIVPWWLLCTMCGVLATFTRSNGIVLAAYPLHSIVARIYYELTKQKGKRKKRKRNATNGKMKMKLKKINVAVVTLMMTTTAILTVLPLVYVDHMGRSIYCKEAAKKEGLEDGMAVNVEDTVVDGVGGADLFRVERPWCGSKGGSLYTFVQKEYWNQGLFNYWTLAQIPNFILAAPILLTCFLLFYSYVFDKKINLQLLGLFTEEEEDGVGGVGGVHVKGIPFVFHCFALSVLCLVFMHVQVSTRFILASSPMPYWYWYDILNKQNNINRIKMMKKKKKKEKENDLDVLDDLELKEDRFLCFTYSRWLLGYIWVFNVVGIVLFSSFYPWT
jgi:phosphatidylinositol glycan class V